MFFVHPAVAWLTEGAKATPYFRNLMHVSGMIAPTFMFLAGISIAMIADRARSSGKDERETKKRIAKRGLEILLLGYGLHLLMYLLSGASGSFQRALKVDILHCIGLSMIIAPWVAWPRRGINFGALIIAVIMSFLSMVMYRLPIQDVLPPFIGGWLTPRSPYSLFPFVPYAEWIMFGLFVGPFFVSGTASKQSERKFWAALLISAALMWLTGEGIKYLYYACSMNTWKVDVPQVKGVPHFFWFKGAVVLLLFVASRLTTSLFDKVRFSFFVRFGRLSLFAYCVHLIIIYPLIGRFFYDRLDAKGQIIGSVLLTSVMLGLALLWERFRVKKGNH
jgi:uncharacterized membrane protein